MDGSVISSMTFEEFLAHYGVKGMRWGVRRSEAQLAEARGQKTHKKAQKQAKRELKEDLKWASKAASTKGKVKAYNAMAKRMNEGALDEVNKKWEGKAPLFSDDPAVRRAYTDEVSKRASQVIQEEAKKIFGDSPNGRLGVKFTYDVDTGIHAVVTTKDELEHMEPGEFSVKVKDGLIVKVGSLELSHSEMNAWAADDIEGFLAHYGVKGMRWGVRRTEAQLRRARQELDSAVKAYNKSPKRKKNIKRLTDAELNERIARAEKERKLGELEKSEGQKIAEDILRGAGSKSLKAIGTGVGVYAGKKIVESLLGKEAASQIPKVKKG